MTVPRPRTLFIEITSECNYRCGYCHMWKLKDAPDALSTGEKLALVEEFAELSEEGEVVFTGGEPTSDLEQLLTLTDACRRLRLRSAVNTNGSYISPDLYDRVLSEGPTYLVYSLDSRDREIHDRHRGIKGSFGRVTAAISDLVRRRERQGSVSDVQVLTNAVLMDDNIDELAAYCAFVEGLGADGVTFQLLSPTFHRSGPKDVFFKKHFFADPAAAVARLREFTTDLHLRPIVRTTQTDFAWMELSMLSPEETEPDVCDSQERNIMVDHKGDVRLCFNMKKIGDGSPVGNVRAKPLSSLWSGARAAAARQIMAECRLPCGLLNCHRREN